MIFHLSHYELISHLRMEGKYQFVETNQPIDKHTHVLFFFEDGSQLRYNDVRKFGRMTLVDKGASDTYKGILEIRAGTFTRSILLDQFILGLGKSHKAIKPLLLDQN